MWTIVNWFLSYFSVRVSDDIKHPTAVCLDLVSLRPWLGIRVFLLHHYWHYKLWCRQQFDKQRRWDFSFFGFAFLCPATKKWRDIMLYPPTFWVSVRPSVRQWFTIRVRSITLIPFEIISRNLAQIWNMTRRPAEINNGHSTYIFAELFPFVIFSIEIVSAL